MTLTIECKQRPEGSKTKALRRSGEIPANLYGHKGTESVALAMDAKTVENLLRKASINNTLIDLKVTDIPWEGQTLLREVQTHPVNGTPYHLSFFAVAGHGEMTVEVPLRFVGDAIGVKQEGGVLDTALTELQVNCQPDNIPQAIEINISDLHVGQSLHLHEVVLPEGVKIPGEREQLVVQVLQTRASTEAAQSNAGTEEAS